MECYLTQLKGHKSVVNSLSQSHNLLASGSADGTVRIWDVLSEKSVRRLTDPDFFPSLSIENVCIRDFTVLVSTSSSLFHFDIRNPSQILLTQSTFSLSFPEEINQISILHDLCCAPLDSGAISIVNYESQDIVITYEAHENICSSAEFLPNNQIISGGFDCKIKLSDLTGKIVDELDMAAVYGRNGINPPHIYQIAVKDYEVSVALGNGNLCVFDLSQGIEGLMSWQAHNERIMCCGYINSSDFLFTASRNDVALWRRNESIKRIQLDHKVIDM